VVPGNLFALVLFLAAVAPGYIFIRATERYRSVPERSTLLEAAELIVIGAASTTAASLVGLSLAFFWDSAFVDVERWADDGNGYLRDEPYRAAFSIGFVLVVGCVVAFAAALLANRGNPRDLVPGATVWRNVMKPASEEGKCGWVSAHLKDGSVVEGYLMSYPTGTSDIQALGLSEPIAYTSMSRPRAPVDGVERAIIATDEIRMIGVRIERKPDTEQEAPGRGRRRRRRPQAGRGAGVSRRS
jgi:Family of unknown function (DUF6338)